MPLIVRAIFSLCLLALGGCRCNEAPAVDDGGDGGDATTTEVEASASHAPPHADAGPDAGDALDPTCEGSSLSLTRLSADRCEISEAEWRTLAALPTLTRAIRPKAEMVVGGKEPLSILFSLVNTSETVVDLPLRYQPARPQLSIVAEDAAHTLFELASPTLVIDDDNTTNDVDAGFPSTNAPATLRALRQEAILRGADAGRREGGGAAHVHSARVRLPPRGAINIRYLVTTTITKRIAPPCDACTSPPRLTKGHYAFHVGHFFVDLGPELARLEVDIP